MKKFTFGFIAFMTLTSCMNESNLDIQGHRGCRGLMPENTIEGFLKACELGVNTLEMDVVVSIDGQVVVSHEPFFNHEITTSPFEIPITEANEKEFNIYQMTTPTVQKFDVGSKVHPRFPNQTKLKTYKPILSEVVNAVKNAGYKPHYNIEIKRTVEGDGVFHPDALSFTKLVVENVINLGIAEVTTIQSFDHDCLNYTKMFAKDLKTVMLVEDENTLSWHLDKLDHQPFGYSPDFHLVDSFLVKSCHDKNIKIIPWTVNEVKDIKKMMNLGVDGIISDYPDRVIAEVRK
ncbi:MAG: glycerophosphodiester phosphodiesterase family protein [Saprospiraceae bacterium]|nr:glycerophosphodiester phosphodiesterase [Saprospiraceae bacterium]HMS68521.1 glycerophosphodiester phosphodiesterase family protein [Saprospiraceae bacterium]